tara:strand:- start:2510 stop:3079 length:570 start_codon:yes stop_codon:yes gene_type:complete
MIRIALVGDMGAGKTYISGLFGCPIFKADEEVAKIYKKDKKFFKKIKKKIPKSFSTFPLRKAELIESILSNKNNLEKISQIIHPLIRKKMNYFIKNNKNKKIVILDIPLFLENKLNKKKDIIVFIEPDKKKLKKKLKKRKNYNYLLIKKLRDHQLPLKIKKDKSDFIIKNDFTKKNAIKSVKKIKEQIK